MLERINCDVARRARLTDSIKDGSTDSKQPWHSFNGFQAACFGRRLKICHASPHLVALAATDRWLALLLLIGRHPAATKLAEPPSFAVIHCPPPGLLPYALKGLKHEKSAVIDWTITQPSRPLRWAVEEPYGKPACFLLTKRLF